MDICETGRFCEEIIFFLGKREWRFYGKCSISRNICFQKKLYFGRVRQIDKGRAYKPLPFFVMSFLNTRKISSNFLS